MSTNFILGTAGHIDHGKTSLIRALTGIDTDRLPEEKRRGITIDIGFANLTLGKYQLGIVDVPGHERFVRNMLAGATGMDLALLVIAADDSIKQQTREHLDILRMLDLKAGLIALTKCDLVEADWLNLVEQEIRQFVRCTLLEEAAIVRTSMTTGQGIDRLREELETIAGIAESSAMEAEGAPFRMAIDRTFTVAGHGTVVTGSISSGVARGGDDLVIEPGGIAVRVRGLQNHDQPAGEVRRGQRAAINLAGVHHDAIRRGQELAAPGHLLPSKLLTVSVSLLSDSPPLKNRTRLRVHLGTAEILATIVLLGKERLMPGESGPAQLYLAEPAVATWNQPLVLRSESPVATIGGGRVLEPNAQRLRRPDEVTLGQVRLLQSKEPVERGAASLFLAGTKDWREADLPRIAGVASGGKIREELLAKGLLIEVQVAPTRRVSLHRQVLEQLAKRVEAALLAQHQRNPLKLQFPRESIAHGFEYVEPAVFSAVLDQMAKAGTARISPQGLSLVGQGPKLSRNEQTLYQQLLEWFRAAGIPSPTVEDCQQKAAKNQASVPQLLALAAGDGQLVEIAAGYYLHHEVEAAAHAAVAAHEKMKSGSGLTLSEIRELLATSRKYAVPLCEYWDKVQFTKRNGDLRTLGNPIPPK
ncbi:MAG: selenocysteine-specific translation elongation factor [Pirellulaceae bacterium]